MKFCLRMLMSIDPNACNIKHSWEKPETIRWGLFDSVQIFLAFSLLFMVVCIHTTHRGFTWLKISGSLIKLDGFDVKNAWLHMNMNMHTEYMCDPPAWGEKACQQKTAGYFWGKCLYLTVKMCTMCLNKSLKCFFLLFAFTETSCIQNLWSVCSVFPFILKCLNILLLPLPCHWFKMQVIQEFLPLSIAYQCHPHF